MKHDEGIWGFGKGFRAETQGRRGKKNLSGLRGSGVRFKIGAELPFLLPGPVSGPGKGKSRPRGGGFELLLPPE